MQILTCFINTLFFFVNYYRHSICGINFQYFPYQYIDNKNGTGCHTFFIFYKIGYFFFILKIYDIVYWILLDLCQ